MRAQADATLIRTALELGGLLDGATSAALDGVEIAGRRVAEGGVRRLDAELAGRLLDVIG